MVEQKPSFTKWLPVILSIVAILISSVGAVFSMGGKSDKADKDISQLTSKVAKLDKSIPQVMEAGVAAGYVMHFDNGVTVYDSGDTGIDINYDMIREYYHPDIMIATNSRVYQASPEQVAWLSTKINPEYILPSHHGTFPFYPKDAVDLTAEVGKQRDAGKTRAQVLSPEEGKTMEVKGLKFTWLGHATYAIESPKGSRIVIDPEWHAANTTYPEDYKDPNKLGSFDLILITHGHFDHFDPKAIQALMKPGAGGRKPVLAGIFELMAYTKQLVPSISDRVAPLNFGAWINKQDIKDANGIDATHLDDVKFAAVWASHTSGVSR
jgi:L-ascorbate metabolism protein UlaG (beta-lactamase superfamily)